MHVCISVCDLVKCIVVYCMSILELNIAHDIKPLRFVTYVNMN